jgi:hypothetical protein
MPVFTAACYRKLSEITQLLFCSTLRTLHVTCAAHTARYVCCARRTLTLHARGSCAAMFHSCTLVLRACSPASRLRGTAARTPTPITCADCPNEYLYQFGLRSVQSFGCQFSICILSVYARLCTRICFAPHYARCAMRDMRAAHSRFALAEAAPPCSIHVLRACSPASRLRGTAARTPTPITCADCPNEYLYQYGSRSVQPFGRQRWICSIARTFECVLAIANEH